MPIKDLEKRRAYNKEYHRAWYAKNKPVKMIQKSLRVKSLLLWLAGLKTTLQCGVCGESNSACLDFHHRNPETKEGSVYNLIYVRGFSKKRILEEIRKCDVLCSNCHRKLHRPVD